MNRFNTWNIGYGSSQIAKLSYTQSSNGFIHPNYEVANEHNNIGVLVLDSYLPSGMFTHVNNWTWNWWTNFNYNFRFSHIPCFATIRCIHSPCIPGRWVFRFQLNFINSNELTSIKCKRIIFIVIIRWVINDLENRVRGQGQRFFLKDFVAIDMIFKNDFSLRNEDAIHCRPTNKWAMINISIPGTIVGFGITEATDKPAPLQAWKSIYPTVVSYEECEKQIKNVNPVSTFCALDSHPDSKKVCEGDKGSALAISHRGVWVLVILQNWIYCRLLILLGWLFHNYRLV